MARIWTVEHNYTADINVEPLSMPCSFGKTTDQKVEHQKTENQRARNKILAFLLGVYTIKDTAPTVDRISSDWL